MNPSEINMEMADLLRNVLSWIQFAKDDKDDVEKKISYLRAVSWYDKAEQFAIENNML